MIRHHDYEYIKVTRAIKLIMVLFHILQIDREFFDGKQATVERGNGRCCTRTLISTILACFPVILHNYTDSEIQIMGDFYETIVSHF